MPNTRTTRRRPRTTIGARPARRAAEPLRFTVAILPEPDGSGYYVVVPALPGCFSQGATVEEARKNVAEAVALHVRALRRTGWPVPHESEPGLQTVVSVVA